MDEVTMMILSAISGGAICLASVSLIVGQKFAKIDQHEQRLSWLGTHCVSKEHCDGLQSTWDSRVEGWVEARDLRATQNTDDHDRILKQNEAFQEQFLGFIAENDERWQKVNDCLIQIQKKQEC